MNLLSEFNAESRSKLGSDLHGFAAQLYPICRSITGDGLRQTLQMISEQIPLRVVEVKSGTTVFDWTVPKEWNIRAAYVKSVSGRRVLDFERCNLHVVNYSLPIRAILPLGELKKHVFTIPDHPDWIPYRTSYYKEDWGFCLSYNQFLALDETEYEVCIDSTLQDGHLSYGECYLPGQSSEEVLISSHACHPSLANDNLSGVAVATFLAKFLSRRNLHYSYRFLFIPGTIGAITWLAQNFEAARRIRHGLVLTCLGDSGSFHYKRSRQGNADIDRAALHILTHCGKDAEILDFSPYGYDERQYCSPGFNLPVGCLMRSVWGTFAEYHTSADNLDFIRPAQMAESLATCVGIINILENDGCYQNVKPYCEPQLGRRNLYRSTGGDSIGREINARLWVLNLSDGRNTLLDIAERSGIEFSLIYDAALLLSEAGLLMHLPTENNLATGSDRAEAPDTES